MIVRISESELSGLIRKVLINEELNSQQKIIANSPIEFFKIVKTKTKGKKIDLSSIVVSMSDVGSCSMTYRVSSSSKPVMILIPFSEESDMGKCPACNKVRQLNPNIQIVKVNGKDFGTFGRNRRFQILAVPTKKKLKKVATNFSKKAVDILKSAKAESFRDQIYDDKCPNQPYPSVIDKRTCGGNLTIGYGTLVAGKPELKKYKKGSKYRLSKDKAAKYVVKHLNEKVLPEIKEKISVPLNQNEFDALTILLYNVGSIGNDLTSSINNENPGQIRKNWSRYSYQDNTFLPGLLKRRKEELKLFFTPVP